MGYCVGGHGEELRKILQRGGSCFSSTVVQSGFVEDSEN